MIWNRKIVIGVVALLLLAFLAYGFWPDATPVTVETAQRDSLQVTVEEEGRTQLQDRYVVSAPTTGYLRRISREAGDSVSEGEIVARLATLPSKVLDASDYRAAAAQVEAARAAVQRAKEEASGADAAFGFAKQEYERIQRLKRQGTASQQQLDRAQVEYSKAKAARNAAEKAVAQARHELEAAQSRLVRVSDTEAALESRVAVRAPIDGQILAMHKESAGVVQAGSPLLTVGHPDSLEVSVDVLSSDAVRIREGTPVDLIRWGGKGVLEGRVRSVPPQGRTEVSALGVEEQRVEVLVRIAEDHSRWRRLGTGYRVVAQFILWAGADVLQVPQSALFRHDGGWAVFAVRDGRAQRQSVQLGHRSGLRAEITGGLEAGTPVVTHPGNDLADGMRVEAR